MVEFYQDFGTIIAFLIMTLIIDMVAGEKGTKYFLLIVLAGMLIFNSDRAVSMLSKTFKSKED